MFCRSNSTSPGTDLSLAVRETFRRRGTELSTEIPIALTAEFIDHPGREAQWKAFLRRGRLADETLALEAVIPRLREFLIPVVTAIARGEEFGATWKAGGPWQPREVGAKKWSK